MVHKAIIFAVGVCIGLVSGYVLFFSERVTLPQQPHVERKIIGFLPYWLLTKAQTHYSALTTVTYFGLTLEGDGTIRKTINEQEREPGWHALKSGIADSFFNAAHRNQQTLSLLVFAGEQETIDALMSRPARHAQALVKEVAPVMKKYEFTDLNLDIESVTPASSAQQQQFSRFVHQVKKELDRRNLGTLTIDVAPDNLIHQKLISVAMVVDAVDYMVLMGYDYHYMGSAVSGPVAPLYGAGVTSEYDTHVAVQKLRESVPAPKILLGLPLYGYEWESLRDTPRSATLPSSGLVVSTRRVEELLHSCSICKSEFDAEAKESYIIYYDEETGMYHHLFYPNNASMEEKVTYVRNQQLGGIALWALGYEDSAIMEPLARFE